MKYREINIEEPNWTVRHDLEEHIPFIFSPESSDNIEMELTGVTLGNLEESMAIPVKAVRHDFMEEDGYRVEASSVIPFGCEPYIARKFEYLGNIIKVTADIRVKAPINGNIFSIDDLVLKGKWKKFAVLDKKLGPKLEWKKIPAKNSVIYESKDLFAVLLLESENGSRIEIGTGFDIWRWNIALGMEDVSGKISVINEAGKIVLKRAVMHSENVFEIPKRDYRFTWYSAWISGEEVERSEPAKSKVYSIDDFELQDSGKVVNEGKCENYLCLHSKAGRNMLRKWLRSFINKKEKEVFLLKGLLPHICENSSHLERPQGGLMLHWDMSDIIDFNFWANRQLRRKDSVLSIFTEKDEIFSQLPSFIGMK